MPSPRRLPLGPVAAAVPAGRRLALAVAVAVGVSAVAVDSADGQFFRRRRVPVQPDPNAADAADQTTPLGVRVPDSPGATERLDRAAKKERQGQWQTAADFYREAVAKFPGRVVPVDLDRKAKSYRYAGVAAVVQERIAKWPAEGLAVYRNLYGPAAADRLAAAAPHDTAAVAAVFDADFVTDAGKAAGLRLIDDRTESGDFAAAAAVGNRLLDLHPTLAGDRPTVLFRTVLAAHWAGDDATANRRLADLRQLDAKAVGSVGGRDVVLADTLATALAAPAPQPAVDPAAADTYPSFGGPGGRGDLSPSAAQPGASLTTVELSRPDYASVPPPQREPLLAQDKSATATASGVIPAVDEGTLFFQDGRTVYAVEADTGRPPAGWLATYPPSVAVGGGDGADPAEAGGRYRLPSAGGRARGEQLTVTVTPSVVLAVMGQRDRLLLAGGGGGGNGFVVGPDGTVGPASPVRLVCLDRATGRELWKASPADLPEAAGAARAGEYVGTPLSVPAGTGNPADDALLVVVRGGKDNQFDDAHVVCLSARTGRFRWATYVGSGTRPFDADGTASQDPSALSLADGRAYVMTNLGVVAALDPADGRVAWLSAYNRDNLQSPDEMRQQLIGEANPPFAAAGRRPWARNPCLVQAGHVFALPTDAKSLLVFDAATGRQVQRIPTAMPVQPDPATPNRLSTEVADVLVGVTPNGTAVLAGERRVFGVDWRRWSAERPAPAWQKFGGDESAAAALAGRPFLTASSLYVVNGINLQQVRLRDLRITNPYPTIGAFSGGQGPGNLLVTGQNVVVAGRDRLDVYTDLAVVAARYQREMSASPADPEPRLRYAAALFAAGQSGDAVAKLDEAINLLGGRDHLRPGPDRQQLFQTLLDFARRSVAVLTLRVDADRRAVAIATADGLYDRAADAADGPPATVAYLLARARFAREVKGDYPAAVSLAQRVLADPALRHVAVTDEQTAAAAASTAIAAAVAVDRASYAAVEQAAATALADARGKNTADALLDVAESYPNSRAAADARRAAVGHLQAEGQTRRAIDVLRQLYAAAGDTTAKAAVLESVAANFLATGPDGVGPAADRLARAAQLVGKATLTADLTLPDNGGVLHAGRDTYAAAVDALRLTLAKRSAARLPDFRLPTYDAALAQYKAAHHGDVPDGRTRFLSPFAATQTVVPNVAAIVHPPRAFNRNDRLVTWSAGTPGGGAAAYDVGATVPRFTLTAVTDPPLGAAWLGDRLVVWTPTKLLAVSADAGRDAWPAPLAAADLPAVGPVAADAGAATDGDPQPVVIGNGDDDPPQFVRRNGIPFVVRNGVRQRVVVRNNQLVVLPPAGAANAPPDVPAALAGGELIAAVVPAGPAGDVLVVTTSKGRVLGVDGHAGTVRWQSRPADRPADAVQANGSFAVARFDDPAGSLLVVYDVPTGRVVGRQKFTPDGTEGQLVNAALGEEGLLALTLAQAVEVKDLYDPLSARPTRLRVQANPDRTVFAGLTGPDQLLVAAGRVVALYAGGRNWQAFDLTRPGGGPTPPMALASQAASMAGSASVRLEGSRLLGIHPGGLVQANLADPEDLCVTSGDMILPHPPHVRDALVGVGHVILLDDPVDRGPAASPNVTLLAVSRAARPNSTRVSGLLDFAPPMNVERVGGIADWAGVDGGVYFLTGDHRLILRRGSRE